MNHSIVEDRKRLNILGKNAWLATANTVTHYGYDFRAISTRLSIYGLACEGCMYDTRWKEAGEGVTSGGGNRNLSYLVSSKPVRNLAGTQFSRFSTSGDAG